MNIKKIEKIKQSKPFKVLDFGVICLAIAVGILSWFLLLSKPGASVEIWHDGQLISTQSLNQKNEIEFEVSGGHIHINIDNGKVWVQDVDCPDQICKKMGKISNINQTIVCSPNNVFIKVTGQSDFDIIS